QEGFNTSKLLSLKPVVFIGLISYSLYLRHWVVLAMMRYIYMDAQLPLAASALAVIIMLLLSVLSYYFVETPARKVKNFTTAKFKWSMA
ncbi:acyltransferase family protein, partial [Neisseria sp. P0003.S003]|uniref:acyltransferase family protein n=1 Tax=Neisseria sp. P0003.S003 TaxID=3436658 RepID=UPI003F7E0344